MPKTKTDVKTARGPKGKNTNRIHANTCNQNTGIKRKQQAAPKLNAQLTSKQSINPRTRINKMNFKPRRTSCSNPSVVLRTNRRV